MNSGRRAVLIIALSILALLLPAFAAPLKVDFANEAPGAEPKALVPVVGVWRIENEGARKLLAVDGRQWKEGQSSAGIADKARALYGERYAEFLDRVQAYAYYPYVVAKDVDDFKNGEITVRFEGLSGRIDQGAGILFNLKPNGDYLTIRANCLENNLVLWKFEKGKRSGRMGSKHPDRSSSMARPEGPDRGQQGRRLSRWQALSATHVAGAGFRTHRPVVQGGQLYAFRRVRRRTQRVRRKRDCVPATM
jgi:hypothetical protein